MDVSERFIGPLAIVDLRGPLTATLGERDFEPLREALDALIERGCQQVVLNLAGAPTADARGLGELARAFKLVTGAGGALALVQPTEKVRKLLANTRLDTVIPVCDSSSQAVRSIGGVPDPSPPARGGGVGSGGAPVCHFWQSSSDPFHKVLAGAEAAGVR